MKASATVADSIRPARPASRMHPDVAISSSPEEPATLGALHNGPRPVVSRMDTPDQTFLCWFRARQLYFVSGDGAHRPDSGLPVRLLRRIFSIVVPTVLRPRRDDKILAPVVQLDPVDVVDDLPREQASSKFLLHDKAVFGNESSTDVEDPVAVANGPGSVRPLSSLRHGAMLYTGDMFVKGIPNAL